MENNEDIKIVEEFIRYLKIDFEYDSGNEIKALENLLSRLKTAERMNDVLAETLRYYNGMQQVQEFCIDICEDKLCDKDNCKECIKEWARKKVEDG